MRRVLVVSSVTVLALAALAVPSPGRDRPFSTAQLKAMKLAPAPQQWELLPGLDGGQFSVRQITRFRCDASGDPTSAVDISCNTAKFGQDFAPDNELAIAVDPTDPDHLLAGSNDYFYRFNNATGSRQALVPTGFFTSFDGGESWVDGQIPLSSGNGAGDPAPAFDRKHEVALMAQLENTGGQGGCCVSQGNVSVSHSHDGGLTWSTPVVALKGKGAGIGPSNKAIFWDKEYIAVDNYPGSPNYGRIYVTSTKFVNGIQGSYVRSPIALTYSDDGGHSWSRPTIVSGSHPSCTYQEDGQANTKCDEDQFGYPAVAPDGTVYVHFHNYQNAAAWETEDLFDAQIMVVKSTDGGATWSSPVQVAQLEDGLADMPYSVIFRQTVWGHQLRWTSAGNISVSPVDQGAAGWDLAIVWNERAAANTGASVPDDCLANIPGTAPDYDPCNAGGPAAETHVYVSTSSDGGATWSPRSMISGTGGSQWFPWGAHQSDGTFVAAWDEDQVGSGPENGVADNDVFTHVLWDGSSKEVLGSDEHIDVSVTHWAGQYTTAWPEICGPAGPDAGKGCNVFHGDYTGLAIDSLDRIHVVWTGFNRMATSPQIDFYTGAAREGYAQDAMYARR